MYLAMLISVPKFLVVVKKTNSKANSAFQQIE